MISAEKDLSLVKKFSNLVGKLWINENSLAILKRMIAVNSTEMMDLLFVKVDLQFQKMKDRDGLPY